jgi:hypothetical protein
MGVVHTKIGSDFLSYGIFYTLLATHERVYWNIRILDKPVVLEVSRVLSSRNYHARGF